ncbi:ABC transporter ATP-binding protein [Amycolatopsis sp. NPDC005232]|uniref:ABC transporter ATP-binding protein n=1 Tax=unclassified Amycolatopsis TaxID=2618356 RepID=UPI001C6A1923|nr:ABC transporter ATP-binding protein [Amycolatopsis sp. DSM 110486]QYN21407.1 ABC transporter ATP-binding protein [Amycolatopsis sp. DSM 110486]
MIRLTGLTKRFPGRTVAANAVDGIDLEIAEGKLVTLLGPSGCGKTTTLRLIAGLERADAGSIELDGKVVSDPRNGVFAGAHRRPIGIVFQSYAIWPHMSVVQNVMFPLRVNKPRIRAAAARKKALDALDLVGLADFAERPAPALSGGQQQRVALARALVREPKVLLLDEPLSNLDAGLRDRMRDEIRAVQQRLGITTVFVTHDQDEALAVSDDVVVMNSGSIVERGRPQEIYARPQQEFTARFLGVSNTLTGVVTEVLETGVCVQVGPGRLVCSTSSELSAGDAVSVFMRPESFGFSRKQHDAEAWKGTVEFSIYHGDCWDYYVRLGDDVLKVRVYKEKVGLAHGDPIFLQPEPEDAIVLPAH